MKSAQYYVAFFKVHFFGGTLFSAATNVATELLLLAEWKNTSADFCLTLKACCFHEDDDKMKTK